MITTYKDIFLRDLLTLRKEVSSFKDQSDLWLVMPGTTNSSGNLCLHLIGNLNHFIGHGLGNLDYIRDRDIEFTDDSKDRERLLEQIDLCSTMIENSFLDLGDDILTKDFPLPWRKGEFFNTHFMLTQLVLHFNYHLGQINYSRRYFNGL